MKATIWDVAREAGVSIASVSNALNGKKKVSKETMRRIEEAVQRLGYIADPAASSLKSKYSHRIGLIVPSIDSAFFPAVIDGLQPVLEENGYIINFFATNFDKEKEHAYLDSLITARADGILLDSVSTDPAFFSELSSLSYGDKRIPVIALEQRLTDWGVTSVYVDNEMGGAMAAEHLLKRNAKHPAHIFGLREAPWSQDRYRGFCRVLREAGIPLDEAHTAQGDFSLQSGYCGAKELLERGISIDGIFVANDLMAIGALGAFREAGLRVPEDLTLIGFDNTFISSVVSPPVTTIDVPKKQLGEEAGYAVLRAVESGGTVEDIRLPLTLIERRSTNPSAQDTPFSRI